MEQGLSKAGKMGDPESGMMCGVTVGVDSLCGAILGHKEASQSHLETQGSLPGMYRTLRSLIPAARKMADMTVITG